MTTSLSPLLVPTAPTLIEFFTPLSSDSANSSIPPLTIMGTIARSANDQVTHIVQPAESSPIFWIGRRTFPTPWLLSLLNLHNSIFIDPPNQAAALWAIDQSLRTGGTRAIIADGSSLDMSATRRIQLACESAHAHCLLARPDRDRALLSAAGIRWHISPALSDNDLPAWSMKLLRDKRSSLFAGTDSPTWIIRTMRQSHIQPKTHHDTLNPLSISPCPLHLSSQLVDPAGNSSTRPRRQSLSS